MIDEWNGLAYLLAELIEKHVGEINIDDLPEPQIINTIETGNIICNSTRSSVDNGQAA